MYDVESAAREVVFIDEEFCKNSGIFFKKDIPEIKKATFSFIKIGSPNEEILTEAEINVSHFIGIDVQESHIQVSRNNITALEIGGLVFPEESDREYVETYL